MIKACSRCGNDKPYEEFHRKAENPDGLRSYCKSCFVETRTKNKRRIERAKRADTLGKLYRPSPNGIGGAWGYRTVSDEEYARREDEKASIAAARTAWKDWLKRAPDAWIEGYYQAQGKPWNNPRLTATQKICLRRRIDAGFNLRLRLADQQRNRLKKRGVDPWQLRRLLRVDGNSQSIEARVGYTIAELKAHLARQFRKGMTWELFCAGKIDIDHIKPLSLFNLDSPADIRAAWALSNLRPLWPTENYQKAASWSQLL